MSKRKILALLTALIMALTMTTLFSGCGGSQDEETAAPEEEAAVEEVDPDVQAFIDCVDVDHSEQVIEDLQAMGSNDYYGYRMGEAQDRASDYIVKEMEDIGLEDVQKDPITVDTFNFKNAELTYTKANGEEETIEMGMYQTTYQATDEEVEVIYVGEGTAKDYKDIDVTGKICLVDINQLDNWWVNWPAYQAKVKGAKAIITVNTEGYCTYSEDTVGVQDVCGPSDAPAFSISVAQAKPLKKAIKKNGGSIKTVLNADAKVTNNDTAYNVSGVIKGKTDETIYLFAHYDAYFRAFSDDTSGLACMLGIAKAIKESGYEPERTMKFIAHANEEWGVDNSRYDWATGAEVEMQKYGDEWIDGAFMAINLDGGVVSGGAKGVRITTPYELAAWGKNISNQIPGSPFKGPLKVSSPAWSWTEAFSYTIRGIPVLDTGMYGEDHTGSYHSTSDTAEGNNYSKDVFEYCHKLYGGIAIVMDKTGNKVFRYGNLFKHMKKEINKDLVDNYDELMAAFDEASAAAKVYYAKCQEMADTPDYEFNKESNYLFKQVSDELFTLDWDENYEFVNLYRQHNIENLQGAIDALKGGDVAKALDEYLYGVDMNWYAYEFDKETYDFFVDQVLGPNAHNSWGTGYLYSEADLWQVINDLKPLYEEKDADVSAQIEVLEKELEYQKAEYAKVVDNEIATLKSITEKMNELAK